MGSRFYLNEKLYLWGDFAAAAILSGLPITIVFLIAQRYLVSGLAEGGVKGWARELPRRGSRSADLGDQLERVRVVELMTALPSARS